MYFFSDNFKLPSHWATLTFWRNMRQANCTRQHLSVAGRVCHLPVVEMDSQVAYCQKGLKSLGHYGPEMQRAFCELVYLTFCTST